MHASADSDEEQWQEEKLGDDPCKCLLCSSVAPSCTKLLEHCENEHGWDVDAYRRRLGLDFHGWVKLVNYVRREHPSIKNLMSLTTPPYPWDDEQFLIPQFQDDPLLCLDIDDEDDREPPLVDTLLAQRLKETDKQLKECKIALSHALDDLQRMKETMSHVIGDEPEPDQPLPTIDACPSVDQKIDSYFESYSCVGIHQEMLKDNVRMEAYSLFIRNNASLFKHKVVLDVGCGTGILAFLASQCGAYHVYAVDQSSIIYHAMDIARENKLHNNITFIRGCVEEVELPVDKVDVIISEWMGYFLLFESMLDTVLFARDKWLKCPKQIFPNSCTLNLAALGDQYEYNARFDFWDNVFGIKMSCMKKEMFREACVMVVDEYAFISSSDVIKRFNLGTITTKEINFEAKFSLTMQHSTVCHGLVGFFDVMFDSPEYQVFFSTSPKDPPTHWKQTVFFFEEPVHVCTGDLMKGVLTCQKCRDNHRSLQITVSAEVLSFDSSDKRPCKINQTYMLS